MLRRSWLHRTVGRSKECPAKGDKGRERKLPFAAESIDQHLALHVIVRQREDKRLSSLDKHQENEKTGQQ